MFLFSLFSYSFCFLLFTGINDFLHSSNTSLTSVIYFLLSASGSIYCWLYPSSLTSEKSLASDSCYLLLCPTYSEFTCCSFSNCYSEALFFFSLLTPFASGNKTILSFLEQPLQILKPQVSQRQYVL